MYILQEFKFGEWHNTDLPVQPKNDAEAIEFLRLYKEDDPKTKYRMLEQTTKIVGVTE